MTNLKLITTETFGDLSCNFYRNMNYDILLTREQIGIALEYSDPSKAIRKIHLKHKDRLDELCIRIRDKTIDNTQNGASRKTEDNLISGKSLLHRKRNYENMSLVKTTKSKLIHGLGMGYYRKIQT